MPRIARIIVEGVPYHITQRGNGRQQVFFTEADHRLYLDLLRANAGSGLDLRGYRLMPNHVHLIGFPLPIMAAASAAHGLRPPVQSPTAKLWARLAGALFFLSLGIWRSLASACLCGANRVRARLAHYAAAHPASAPSLTSRATTNREYWI